MKKIFYLLLAIQSLLYISSCLNVKGEKKIEKRNNNKNILAPQSNNDTIAIIGVGDIMLGTNFPKSPNYLPPNKNPKPLWEPLFPILQDANVTFGNCEGAFSNNPEKYTTPCSSSNCYRFSMPEAFADCFVEAGFDVLSIANNHVGDIGQFGRKNTPKVLKSKNIKFAGQIGYPSDTFTIDGVKYGFCAFSPNSGTYQMTNYDKITEIVKSLEDICDIVIVSVHGGAEGSKHQHVTRKNETFLGYNRGNVYKFARVAIDAGADIIFGHGPHVIRAIDIYKNRFIIYSMGNFCTYRRFNLSGSNGVAPIVKVYTNKKGEFIKAKIISVKQDEKIGTRIDTANKALEYIKKLTKEDFPELNVKISDDGWIYSN